TTSLDVMPEVSLQDGFLVLTYREVLGREDLVYEVGWSEDLAVGFSYAATPLSEVGRSAHPDAAGIELVSVRSNLPVDEHPHQFLCLWVRFAEP
ncbi:MAG: hypothetical protein ACFCU3_09080, partial [Verrucomicrobiales bacterium]